MTTIPLPSDEQWAVLEPLLPPVKGRMGKPLRDYRPVVEGAIYRLKAGILWRYLPADFSRRAEVVDRTSFGTAAMVSAADGGW